MLRRTFDAGVLIKDGGVEDLRAFMAALLALRRTEYEKAIRAIRQVVRACGRAADDPTLAYTMLVAALESLSGDTTAGPADWQAFDRDKRGLIDGALQGVPVLAELPPEAWVFTQHAEHLRPAGGPGMLSLEGLNRLARHVIRNYVARAPTDLDAAFDYRDRLPGVLRMQLAAQYWLSNPAGISQSAAAGVLEGLVEVLVEVLAGRDGAALPDMREALARIEEVVPGRDQQAGTAELVAVYSLWHAVMGPEYHRPRAAAFLDRYERLLDAPTMTAFVLRALEAEPEPWPADDLAALAVQRLDQRRRGKAHNCPRSSTPRCTPPPRPRSRRQAGTTRRWRRPPARSRRCLATPGSWSTSRHCGGTPRRRSTCARSCSACRTTPRTATARTAPRTATAPTTRRLSAQGARCTTARARTAPEPATRGPVSRPAHQRRPGTQRATTAAA